MKKTSAPWILFVFLGILVCCIVASVVIALRNPPIDDDAYFSSKKEVEQNINQIIQDQNDFDRQYELYLGANKIPKINGYAKLSHPFPATNQENSQAFLLDFSKNSHLYIKAICKEPENLSISFYIEKIGHSNEKVDLGLMRYYEKGKYFISQTLPHLPKGRYKAIVEVRYLQEGEKKRIFFEKEIFSI